MGLGRDLPNNEYQAAVNADTPSSANPFATENVTNGLQAQINALTPANVLISGAVVYSGTGFTYNVTALVYKIQNVQFTTTATSVTLSPADLTNPRIDVIYADNTGSIGILTGVPSASPVKPTVNPLTQLELTFVTVPAGATSPTVTTVLVYNENTGTPTEWAGLSDDPNVDFASALDPYLGIVSINTLAPLGTNREIVFTPAAPYTINGGTVNFRIKAKTPMNTATGILYIGFFNAGLLVGNSVYIGGSNLTIYGFDPNNTTSYQLVAIPISAFGVLPGTVQELRIFKLSGGSTANFFLDAVQVQEGIPTPPVPTPGHQILDELTVLTQRGKLAFVGAGVTASDDPANDKTIVTIPGGGGSSKWKHQEYAYNFSTGGGTFNGVATGPTALATLADRYRLATFAGTGAADSCYTNTVVPTDYTANANIRVTLKLTCGSAGNTFWAVGLTQLGVGDVYGGEGSTQYLTGVVNMLAGFQDNELVLTFSGVGINPTDPLVIVVYRDPGNASDTNTADAYLNQILIEEL